MEGVQTVDVSWLHHSQKDNLSRTKSVSSTVSDKPDTDGNAAATTKSGKSHRRSRSNSSPARSAYAQQSASSEQQAKGTPQNDPIPEEKVVEPEEKPTDQKPATPSPSTQRSSPKPIGRRNSWISSLSSKFSSGSTPPSQSSLKGNSTSPKTASPLDSSNSFGAAYGPKDKEEEQQQKKEDPGVPVVSSSPKGPSFLHNALRKFSSNSGGLPKLPPGGGVCQRRVLNLDPYRDRCKIADLNQAKLHRVAFCVDVEIAGVSHRDSDEEAPPTNQLRQGPLPESNAQKSKKADVKTKEKGEADALKHPETAVLEKETSPSATAPARDGGDAAVQPSAAQPSNPVPTAEKNPPSTTENASPSSDPKPDAKPNGEGKEPTRKQEKKKRSEEERRERREKKRRQAVANGSVPLQLDAEMDEDDSRTPTPDVSRKTQSHPTTDPVRIYRRCCQLRETPVLKRVVDEISSPSSTLAESPGTVGALDLSNFPMTSQDIATFSDWLAVVPVRKLILENCALNDESTRAILAGLLATKTVEQMRYRRRRARRPESVVANDERYGVVEKLSLKNNPKIGREGWRHIGLFIHLSKSLKAIDLSGIPFPKIRPAMEGQASNPALCVSTIFANALAARFSGDHLEELLLSECKPSADDVKNICEAATSMGLRRLGFANNNLTREGLQHVVEYLKAGQCEGLDLGGNPIKDDFDLLTDAIEAEQSLYALSLADCSLTPTTLYPLLQALTRLHNLRFIDFSHNPELFSTQTHALGLFRRFLPKMPSLKRIHLADVNLSPDHAISLAEILPECPSLCHLNILENPQIGALASATDPTTQEEACAVYASMMAAVRVSRTIIAVDIDIPSAENNEVVKALASQIMAYCLRNLEGGAIAEELSDVIGPTADKDVPVPDILQHIVGNAPISEEPLEAEGEPAPDEDYVIGGTGVVKALGVCLSNLDQHGGINALGGHSPLASGTTTPRRLKSRDVVTKRPRDMSKNLLESARNIRARIQTALIREDRAGNDANYRRLQFLDFTLHRMIQRFEDEYPETRIAGQGPPAIIAPDTSSQHSGDQLSGDGEDGTSAAANTNNVLLDNENAIDDEETDQYAIRLSRASSITSLHSRAMTSEEGHVHRLGQNLRRDLLMNQDGEDNESRVAALREKLDRLHDEQPGFEGDKADKAFEKLGSTVDELWAAQQQDAESFERFRQSQLAAQWNAGVRQSPGEPSS
ncbi:hypothetical protein N7474_002162 [Penicillium riverlandense]|uniref:uncharacterized protein n=1 Tax=Penicillium riverlandense TaxID=1903569 RepID=UPI002548E77C|nr:uncharacterized protein N7474_002162 [Penicillium riverlandense]KAJ5833851.1 hypothetical protein N7474_002162 [Penicillium riverlandense]